MVLKSAKLVKQLIAICCAGVMAASAAACGANTDTRTQITVWSWEPSMKQVIAGFEKDNPDIHVVWKNTSGYDKLNNAIQDGYGIPDVVQLEYYALRQYAVSSQLVPITGRTEGYADFYTPGTWRRCSSTDGCTGFPWTPARWPSSITTACSNRLAWTRPRSAHGTTTTRPPKNSRKSACTSPPIPATPASTTR